MFGSTTNWSQPVLTNVNEPEGSQERYDEKIAALTQEAAEWRVKAAVSNSGRNNVKKLAALKSVRKAEAMVKEVGADAALLEMEEEEDARKEVARDFKANKELAAAATEAEEV
ncbi:hypothetical protein NKR19_g9019 [Coniochaeta hoffmannii]|uniref:Uncharacterized protein n=1 Tax=Coniochaeta hoffmannii TaxID=91930 RepID=A0AA38R9G4_9PEZI|nr:hypothetical protein NKR19_g9019 [Coniochaeta hoffmannii]